VEFPPRSFNTKRLTKRARQERKAARWALKKTLASGALRR